MKSKTIYISLLLMVVSTSTMAQSVAVQWLKNSDGASWDLVSDMRIDTADNIYVAGNFTSTAKKDIKSSEGNKDIFIAKYDSDGEQNWFHQIKSKDYCHINSLDVTHDDHLLISGFFNKEIQLGETKLIAEKGNHAFFAVLDTSGNFQMVKHIEGYFKGLPIFVKQKADTGYWFVGSYTRDITIDSCVFEGNYCSEIFIGSFNEKGELDKHILLRGNGADEVNDVVLSPDGNLVVTGSFEQNLNIDSLQLFSKGYTDAFLVELNADMEVIDFRQMGGIYKDYGQSICFDKEQNCLWTGCFSADIKLDDEHHLQSKGNLDVYVAKYNNRHELLWIDQFGGRSNDYVISIATNEYNSIYLNGSFRGSIEKEECEIESIDFSSDLFLAKYNKNGQFKYIEALGDTNADYARQLVVDSENYIYLSGNFNQQFKALDNTSENADGEDYFLTQLYDCEFSIPVSLPSDTSICGEVYSIIADTGYAEYIWNETTGTEIKKADTTSMYYLVAKDQHKCISRDSIFVQLNNDPIVDLGNDLVVYQGEIVHLAAEAGMESYKWNDKSTLSFMEVNTQNLKEGFYHYSVTVTDTNLCKGDGEISIEILEVEDPEKLNLKIFPNPVREHCIIQLHNIRNEENLTMELYTLEGTRLWELKPEFSSTSLEMDLNMQNMIPGIYILIVKNGATTLKDRIVVLK